MACTRINNSDWIIGSGHEVSLGVGRRLPANLLVPRRYYYLQQQGKKEEVRDTFRLILAVMNDIWSRANIPIKGQKNCLDQLMSLYKSWKDLTRLDEKEKSCQNPKIDAVKETLKKLCDISSFDVYEQLKSTRRPTWKEDWNFLQNQRLVPQVGYLGGVDGSFQSAEKRKALRASRNEETTSDSHHNEHLLDLVSSSSQEEEEEEPSFVPREKKRRPDTVVLELPTRDLSKAVAQTADRSSISIRKQTMIQANIISAGGGSVSNFTLSSSSVHRHRQAEREKIADRIKENWIAWIADGLPKSLIIHWDSKLITHFTGNL